MPCAFRSDAIVKSRRADSTLTSLPWSCIPFGGPQRVRVASRPSLLTCRQSGAETGLLLLATPLAAIAAAISIGLWTVEKQTKARVEADLQTAQGQLDQEKDVVRQLQRELQKERQARKELESLQSKLEDSGKEILKLERALEMKDGQVSAFMTVARRQIKLLEDKLKEK